jgi:nucleoside-diphosphate-sugar epimerase
VQRFADDNEIVVYDNLSRNALGYSGLADHDNVTLVKGDVLDIDNLNDAIESSDIVIHLAAIAGVDAVIDDIVKTLQVNVIGTYNVLRAAAQIPIELFLDFSTSEVYGPYAYMVDETQTTQQGPIGEARWAYAVGKLAGEYFGTAYHRTIGLPVVTVRPFNIYGPGQVGGGAIKAFVLNVIKGEDLTVHGDGSQIRAWCYIDDLVDCVSLILAKPSVAGLSFNIGDPRSIITIYNLALEVIRVSETDRKVKFQTIDHADVGIRSPNIDLARELLGFEPRVDLRDGIERTLNWYSGNLAFLRNVE